MMKNIIPLITFCAVLAASFFLLSQGEEVKHDQNTKLTLPTKKSKDVSVLDEINSKNAKITTFLCDDLRAIAQMPGKRAARLNGSLAYEKERKFRLELGSILGSELDIGSDGELFWFWSRRLKEPGLYWAYYKDFNKTRLKTPFNPFWFSHCLGIDRINYQDAVIDSSEEKWRIIKKTTNAQNQPVTAITYVDPVKKLITGHGMYDSSGKLVASSEIQTFQNDLPAKITFIWHNEDSSMIWYLHSARMKEINKSRWIMPEKTPKIDMSRD